MKSILLATAALAQEATKEADESIMAMADVPANVMKGATAATAMGTEFDTVAMDDGVFEVAGTSADGTGFTMNDGMAG